MNWKKFLKPTRKKVLVFVILCVILLFIPIILCNITYPYPDAPIKTSLCSPFQCILDIVNPTIGGSCSHCNWIYAIFVVFIFYLFSCMILFAYDKFRVKK